MKSTILLVAQVALFLFAASICWGCGGWALNEIYSGHGFLPALLTVASIGAVMGLMAFVAFIVSAIDIIAPLLRPVRVVRSGR